MKYTYFLLSSFLIYLGIPASLSAGEYNLRQFSSRNGLSNSAILSICQDRDGLVWIGTCDGLNVFNGSELKQYKPANVQNNLSGNLIDNMMEADNNTLWVQTNYGLKDFLWLMFDQQSRQ